jgi:crotonobetainyl-CoA:carnitine CoA-transferase CaiB-like acyl-CoA transferase
MPETKDALSDVRVVEFGGYAAGPAIGKYLANFGARVIHVESEQRPDGFRLQYPPFKDDQVGLNRSGCFSYFNDSKYGVTIDLKSEEGLATAIRLTDRADIVIENMRPGVMDRLGLGYPRLSESNPELVMLSTSNMGQSGPYSTHPGFGSQLSSLSGFTELIGKSDGPPNLLYGPYIDLIAVAYGGAVILAALDYRRRTGKGAHIDLSQYETGVQFLAPALLDFAANGRIAHRNGNRDPFALLHGCYPCRDGQWCAISCWDEAELERLDDVTGGDIAEWTRDKNARDVMDLLQRRGVHAAAVNSVADLFSDPQLESRNIWQQIDHAEIGPQKYRMVAYQLSETPGRVRRPAPCLGEDNEEVLSEVADVSPPAGALKHAAAQRRK